MPDPGADLFDNALRVQMERDALAPYLMGQRWFGGKARHIASTSFTDWALLSQGPPPAWLTIVQVSYVDGAVERYQLPLVVLSEANASASGRPDPDRAIYDALMDDRACRAIVRAILLSADLPAAHGAMAARPVAPPPRDLIESDMPIVRLPGVHSNSALAVGGRYLLKLFRRIEPGVNPDVEIGQFLARSGAHVHTPALMGTLEYRGEDGTPATLALLQELVSTRMNAWEHALESLATFYAAAALQTATPAVALVRTLPGNYLESAALVGQRTAELHAALGSSTTDTDFVPEQSTPAEMETLITHILRRAADALDLLDERGRSLDPEAQALARQVLDRRGTLLARLEALGRRVQPIVRIRIHGDYHLGQVLQVGEDFVIIDFEGEPTRPLAERRAKQSPLRDVAGMLRSFGYAAHAGLLAIARNAPEMRAHLAGWSRAWEASAGRAFVQAYLAAARGSACVPADPSQVQAALDLFVTEKALYELQYEMNNRPLWASIPLTALATMKSVSLP